MKKLTFYGASDDLIEVEGDLKGCDEYNGEDASFHVAGLKISVIFNGCWEICVCQIDEDVTVGAENLRLSVHERGYSMQLEMDVPDDAYISKIN